MEPITKPFSQMLIFNIIFQTIICAIKLVSMHIMPYILALQYNMVNIALTSLHTLNNTCQLKKSYEFVIGICLSVNEFVVVVIHLA